MTAARPVLDGVRVLEFAGLGPVPFAGMLLADMGADIVQVVRPGTDPAAFANLNRGRQIVEADLKSDADRARVLELVEQADIVIEGFRPGVMERLGLGPEQIFARNPACVFGRMTGWGQTGPNAQQAGHDLNYISTVGLLAAIGPQETPVPPLNVVADYGGGALYLVVGVLAALLNARTSGQGQVVDAAMCDGAASMTALMWDLMAQGRWRDQRASNAIDGGAPYYGVYRCADGAFLAVAPMEPQFFREFCSLAGLPELIEQDHLDPTTWPILKPAIAQRLSERSREEWDAVFAGSDACVTPVIRFSDAPHHPANAARDMYIELGGVTGPAPAPRFGRTPSVAAPHKALPLSDIWK